MDITISNPDSPIALVNSIEFQFDGTIVLHGTGAASISLDSVNITVEQKLELTNILATVIATVCKIDSSTIPTDIIS